MSISVTIRGTKKAELKFKQLPESYARQIQREIGASALVIERTAKERVPVDSGRLRSSIRNQLKTLRARVFTNVIYAKFVEFGTRIHKTLPKPFLFPAFEQERPRLIKRIIKILKSGK